MTNNYLYIFECDYGNRVKERQFLKDILNEFDKDYATMVGVFVNNNPYCLEFIIAINLQKDPVLFENWLKTNYPNKSRLFNIFLKDLSKYNGRTFLDDKMVDSALISEGNGHPFIWPERTKFESENPQYKGTRKNLVRVFLSHSSRDKEKIVNPLNAYLQGEDIGTWIDSAEIDYGDNIVAKINEGLENCDVGLFILTDNFFDEERSKWPTTEFSTYFMSMMSGKKNILLINADVSPDKMPPLMKPYKYLEWTGLESLEEIGKAIKKIINK